MSKISIEQLEREREQYKRERESFRRERPLVDQYCLNLRRLSDSLRGVGLSTSHPGWLEFGRTMLLTEEHLDDEELIFVIEETWPVLYDLDPEEQYEAFRRLRREKACYTHYVSMTLDGTE